MTKIIAAVLAAMLLGVASAPALVPTAGHGDGGAVGMPGHGDGVVLRTAGHGDGGAVG